MLGGIAKNQGPSNTFEHLLFIYLVNILVVFIPDCHVFRYPRRHYSMTKELFNEHIVAVSKTISNPSRVWDNFT